MDRAGISKIFLNGLLLALFVVSAAGAWAQGTAETNSRLSLPRSSLGEPFVDRVHLVGFGGLGFGGYIEGLQYGGGGALVIRPGTAERFLEFLDGRNASFVLQLEYHRVDNGRRILSGDAIVRCYRHPFGGMERRSLFLGAGLGGSDATLPDGDTERGMEAVLEIGQEWNLHGRLSLAFWQLQYRFFRYHGTDFSHLSLKVGAGVPLPW